MFTRPLIFMLIALPLTLASSLSFTKVLDSTAMSEEGIIAYADQQEILQLQERGSGRRENPNRV